MMGAALFTACNCDPDLDPRWVLRLDGRKVFRFWREPEPDLRLDGKIVSHPWPEWGAQYPRDDGNVLSAPDPQLLEVVRFLARRAARQWFAQARGNGEEGQ
jgi:hypothetical protein